MLIKTLLREAMFVVREPMVIMLVVRSDMVIMNRVRGTMVIMTVREML